MKLTGFLLLGAGWLIVLAAVAKLNSDLLLPLIVVFALAYTFELAVSLVSYFGNGPL